jgi:hypothetical protein
MFKRASVFLISVTCAFCANAQIHVTYDFDDTNDLAGPSFLGLNAAGSDFTAGAFTGGNTNLPPGISATSGTAFTRTFSTGATTADGNSLADAVANDAYWSFTLTASGGDLSLVNFGFDYFATSIFGTFSTALMSDAGGFADGSEIGIAQITSNAGDTFGFDISSLGTLPDGDSIEFRLYQFDASTSQSRIHRLDNLVVGVPEPTTFALAGLGLAGLLVFRKRH